MARRNVSKTQIKSKQIQSLAAYLYIKNFKIVKCNGENNYLNRSLDAYKSEDRRHTQICASPSVLAAEVIC